MSTRRRHEIEEESEELVDSLREKISNLKTVSIDIGQEVKEHNKFLRTFGDDVDKSDGILRGAMGQVLRLHRAGHHRYICWLLLFAVFVFLILYALGKWKS